jgi:esterase/lipase
VAPQPISLRPFYEKITEALGIADRIDEVDTELRRATSFTMDEMSVTEYAKAVNVPTFIIQVRDDILTKPSDVQTIFDNIPVKDKKLF